MQVGATGVEHRLAVQPHLELDLQASRAGVADEVLTQQGIVVDLKADTRLGPLELWNYFPDDAPADVRYQSVADRHRATPRGLFAPVKDCPRISQTRRHR